MICAIFALCDHFHQVICESNTLLLCEQLGKFFFRHVRDVISFFFNEKRKKSVRLFIIHVAVGFDAKNRKSEPTNRKLFR